MSVLERNAGRDFGFASGQRGYVPQPDVVASATAWFAAMHPALAATLGTDEPDDDALLALLATVDWSKGDADRGRALYTKRGCVQCHGGSRAMGPDLKGAAKRFAREDLFRAIALPEPGRPAAVPADADRDDRGHTARGADRLRVGRRPDPAGRREPARSASSPTRSSSAGSPRHH